ncbi:Caffeic acid 3-O-methyltransferase 1 [Vitis vinifera]|uniref:Caffeic acid 3-O-methyltransferase 1 n=1 Tax=Vitis vinifera TaxID=29760 RepID=A0A438I4G7_VITVI|nr:Caffeic acid 3-O-methyltransferase 1 [Vitis vinifera]
MVTSTEEEEDSHRQYAMQLVSASVLPVVLKAALELGVLEIIERAGPGALLSPSKIASHLPIHNNPDAPFTLDRILRLLASHSILTCSLVTHHDGKVHRLYGLAPVSKYFIPNQDGVSLAPFLHAIQDKVIVDTWNHLKDAVLEGGLPFKRTYGMDAIDYVGKDARLCEVFRASFRDYNPIFMNKILETYSGFEGLKSLVDVGGSNGSILNMIVSKYPSIKGINFDLAPVIEKSPSILDNLVAGVEHVAGGMFTSVPNGDAIFMKWILHSWNDEKCLKLLRNCYQALPDNGKVLVVDMVIPETPEPSAAVKSSFQPDFFSTNMKTDRKERTEAEFAKLGKEAGFSSTKVACCAYNFSVVEFHKNM